jgi:hypothetical protein
VTTCEALVAIVCLFLRFHLQLTPLPMASCVACRFCGAVHFTSLPPETSKHDKMLKLCRSVLLPRSNLKSRFPVPSLLPARPQSTNQHVAGSHAGVMDRVKQNILTVALVGRPNTGKVLPLSVLIYYLIVCSC